MQTKVAATMPARGQAPEHVLAELERLVGPRNFEHWFRGKTTLTICEDQVTLGVASVFLQSWMHKQFAAPASEAARRVLGPSASARFAVDASAVLGASHSAPPRAVRGTEPTGLGRPVGGRADGALASGGGANGRRRFASLAEFVSGRCNELALTAVREVCRQPGELYSPLFLYGGVGTGKTHLLEAVYRELRRSFPTWRVTYLTAEAFTNYFTQALREHALAGFRARFRHVDALLVDDIDFLDGKPGIQEEFLHTVKQLEGCRRQIVLAADRHPRLLAKFSEELTTRFLSGLVCRLEPPDPETRRRILAAKARRLDDAVTDEALAVIAQRFQHNVRELEGALNCLQTYHAMTGKRISAAVARSVLAELERDCIRVIRLSDVEQAVCQFFGVEPADLRSSRRHRSVSQPRMLAMFLARKHTQAAYSEIGRYFGGRNHSTVVAAERKVRQWLAENVAVQVSAETWPLADVLESVEMQLRAG